MKTLTAIAFLIIAFCGFSVSADEAIKALDPIRKDAKHPAGVNLELMSEDPEYGYSDSNPILVGSEKGMAGGPEAEWAYLNSLLDSAGEPIRFRRLFSGGNSPDRKPLDCYEITLSDGKKVRLWINMYHPDHKPANQPAPVGFYKKKAKEVMPVEEIEPSREIPL